VKAQYISVWKLHGANTLVTSAPSLELTRLSSPSLIASVTADPEPHFLHIDRSVALATQLLKGIFSPDKEGTPEQRLAAEIENVKSSRAKQTDKGVFLVIVGEDDIAAPNLDTCKVTEAFTVCFDALEKPKIRELFRPSIEAVLTALSLSLSANADRQNRKSWRSYLSCRIRRRKTHLHV
jgi:hypothetical protein